MTRWRGLLVVAMLAYLASGFYVVGGDETAVVRRFGRALSELRHSGLHYELPWPFSRVDRSSIHTALRSLLTRYVWPLLIRCASSTRLS